MKRGDRLQVLEGDYSGYIGVMDGVTSEGHVVVLFGNKWKASFPPHHVDLAPITLWSLLVTPNWLKERVK
jgi:hypothetical protein